MTFRKQDTRGVHGSQLAVFRADANPTLGGGHISRCLAFANGLRVAGWSCTFAVSPETLETIPALCTSDHTIIVPEAANDPSSVANSLSQSPNLLIIDHYGLDISFETPARAWADHILVIDDLADRYHDCDFLMDQTLGRTTQDYQNLVPQHSQLLLGPQYALLRPEFSELRTTSLTRQSKPPARILISIGSSDPNDITSIALSAIQDAKITCSIDVVLGSISPNIPQVKSLVQSMEPQVTLHLDTPHMAKLMAQADLAIGACGVTSWERCSLGLPTLAIVIADNQRLIAEKLQDAGAIIHTGDWMTITANTLSNHLQQIMSKPQQLATLSKACSRICDGRGTSRLVKTISVL